MTSAVPRYRHTFQEYLFIEKTSAVKHEYLHGEMYAMAGASAEHVALCAVLVARLFGFAQGGPCRVYGSDFGVRVQASGLATYSDVTVVCGPLEHDSESTIHYTNPTMIFEVLSPATENYDRGEKRKHFQRIESLREYVIVAQDRRHAEKWTREPNGAWKHDVIGPEGSIELQTVGGAIGLADLYRDAGL